MKKGIISSIVASILLIICMLLSTSVMAVTFPDDCSEIKIGEIKSHYLSMWSSDVFYKFIPANTGCYKITMKQGNEVVYDSEGKQISRAVDGYYESYYKLEKGKIYYIEMYSNSSSGKTVTMQIDSAEMIQFTDSVVTTLTMKPSSKGIFEFAPQKDGLYRFDITVPDATSDSQVIIYAEGSHLTYTSARYNTHHFASFYILKKGVTYYGDFSCIGTKDTVVNIVAKPEPVTKLSLSNRHQGTIAHAEDIVVLSFTPSADGIYRIVHSGNFSARFYDSDFKNINSNFSEGYNSLYGYEPRFMKAGQTYHYMLSFYSANIESYNFTVEKATAENLNLTSSTQINVSPNEVKFYKFVPTYEGIYNFTLGSTVCDGKSSTSTVVLYDENFEKIISSKSYVEKKLDQGKTYYYTIHPNYYTKENVITYSFMGEQIVSISENADIKAEITTAGKFKYYKFTPSYANGAIYDVSFTGTSTPKIEVCNKNLEPSVSKTESFSFEKSRKEDDYTILKVGFSDSQKTGTVNLTLKCHELIHLENGKEYTANITKAGDYRYFYYDGYDDNDEIVVFDAYGDFTSSITMMYSPNSQMYGNSESRMISEVQMKYFMVKPVSEASTGELKVKVSSCPFQTVNETFSPITIEIKNPGDCVWIKPDIYFSYPDEKFSIISEGKCDTYIDAYKYGVSGLLYAGNDDNSGEENNFFFDMNDFAFCCVKLKDGATGTFTVRLRATSDKKITLGGKNTVSCVAHGDDASYSSFVYTPTQTGLYRLNMSDTPENMISTTCEIYDYNGKLMTWGGWENIIYLQANKEYLFRSYAYSESGNKNSYFILNKVSDGNLGELPLNKKNDLNLPNGAVGYYTYKAETDETLYLISEGTADCVGYMDLFNISSDYINSQIHKNFKLRAGEEYIIYFDKDIYAKILKTADNTTITTSDADDLKSGYYENDMDKSWIYNAPEGTLYNEITFDSETLLGDDDTIFDNDDFLYVYNGDGDEVGKYTGKSLQGKTLIVKGESFKLRLVTNRNWINYGFKVSDVKNVDVVPAPAASISSGVIKPSTVSLTGISIADIYYKIDTESADGEYIKYTEPFEIIDDCELTVYAEINGVKSENISYKYTIDTTPIAEPVITSNKLNSGSVSITASAAEGKIYYRYIGRSSIYEYKKSITLSSSDVIEFYAQLGNVKSNSVIYKCEVKPTNETYVIKKPNIEAKPILGGFEVSVTLPAGVTLCNKENIVNYADDHPQELCGDNDNGFIHSQGIWKYSFDNTALSLIVRKISGISEGDTYNDSSEFPKKYTITETAAIYAQINRNYENSSGTWSTYTESDGFNMHTTGRTYAEVYESSEESFVFLEIPKAIKPFITTASDKLYVYSQDNAKVYYSINNSDPTEYTGPVSINSGDDLKVYAIDYGVAKSDVAEHTYTGDAYTSSTLKYEILDNTGAFRLSEDGVLSGSVDILCIEDTTTRAMLLLVAYDKDTDQFITMSETPVEFTSDITKFDDIQLPGLKGKEVYVKAFLWDGYGNMKPLSMAKMVYITPEAMVSVYGDITVVTVSSPKEISGEIIVALYDTDDKLQEVDIQPASPVVYPEITKTQNVDYAKIMWWDLESMEPECMPEIINLSK